MRKRCCKFELLVSTALSLALGGNVLSAYGQSGSSPVGDCEPALAEAYLNGNNVYARILNNGELFYRGEPHVYRVPRFSTSNAIFSSSVEIGGLIDGAVHTAASRYGPYEFWAGPLDDNGAPPEDCRLFDRIYKVRRADIDDYERTGQATTDLLDWPTGLGAPTLDADGKRINVSGLSYNERLDRVIDLAAGERPEILGDLALWWTSNDRGNVHDASDSPSLGIELHGYAYVFSSSAPALNNATFYRFTVFSRNSEAIRQAYFGVFSDPDLGDAGDDYVGSDTLHQLGYFYNSTDFDGGREGYGRAPPALGYQILRGPRADDDGYDNDRDGVIDEPDERPGLSAFVYYNNGGGPNEDPSTAEDYYNYFRARWKNGNPILYGGDGFETGVSTIPTRYMYSGDPVTRSFWSELNVDGTGVSNSAADRRFILSSGPFDLLPGDARSLDFAIVYGRGSDNLNSITRMREASDGLQFAFDSGFSGYPRGRDLEGIVRPVSPADWVTAQAFGVEMVWEPVAGAHGYELVLSSLDGDREVEVFDTKLTITDLLPNRLYGWKVRGMTAFGGTRFSEWRHFATVQKAEEYPLAAWVVQNQNGILTNPDVALYADEGFGYPPVPCPVQPILYCARPTRGYQQSSSSSVWALGYHDSAGSYSALVDRLSANGESPIGTVDATYELRWTGFGGGSLGYDRASSRWIDVGFELWNVGTGPAADDSDDFRMVPFVDLSHGGRSGAGGFSIGGDHRDFNGPDDPYSNYISWYDPADRTPGDAGYRSAMTEDWDDATLVFQDMVLVQVDGGATSPYAVEFPEVGTVFRLVSHSAHGVSLASPADNEEILPGRTRFYWTGSAATYSFQIAETADFSNPIYTVPGAVPGFSLILEPERRYFWRVGDGVSSWSTTWSLSTLEAPGSAKNDALVTGVHSFPNPALTTTTLQFYLREESRVGIEIVDALGRPVLAIPDTNLPVGPAYIPVDANGLAAGTYFYTIRAGDFSVTKSLVVVR